MKKISSSWGFAVRLVHKPSCHHLFYQVIACTLDFLLLLLMQLLQIVVSQYSIIQGDKQIPKDYYFMICCAVSSSKPNCIRASPCEFVIPLSKYVKAVYHTRVSVGMRFRMLFETEESSVRR